MDDHSVKENFTPSSAKVSYPRLPKGSPPRQIARNSEPYGSHTLYDRYALLRSPSNIGRRRAACVGALTKSPPRSSHANKVKDIFAAPAPGVWSGTNLQNTPAADTPKSIPNSRKTATGTGVPSSPLTSESELERRLASPDCRVMTHESSHIGRASAPLVPSNSNEPDITVESPQNPIYDESSSEAWTGDETFIPRSTRRQNRLESDGGDGIPVGASCGIEPVRPPRSSRFRPNPIYTPCPKLRGETNDMSDDHQSSDADDEGDSDL